MVGQDQPTERDLAMRVVMMHVGVLGAQAVAVDVVSGSTDEFHPWRASDPMTDPR